MQHGGGRPMVAATLVLLLWNMVSWAPEVILLRYAQRCSPALAADRRAASTEPPNRVAGGVDKAGSANSSVGGTVAGGSRAQRVLQQQLAAWSMYARQPAAAAAAALALLYLTVLSWGTLMTAYIKALGLPEAELALYRGCAPFPACWYAAANAVNNAGVSSAFSS